MYPQGVETQLQPTSAVVSESNELKQLVEIIGQGALERDRDDEPPFEQIDLIREARLGALRVPVALGGKGASLHELFEVVICLADADPNVAHIIRNHFAFVEGRLRVLGDRQSDRWLSEVARGGIFGLAGGEVGSPTVGNVGALNTILTPQAKHTWPGI
jgi:alkylation response protein AidB-like acyl-CoA dehydrogenase